MVRKINILQDMKAVMNKNSLRIIIFMFLLFSCSLIYAEDVIKKEEAAKEGLYKEYYESGALASEGNYKNGKKQGLFKEYDELGRVMWERNYKQGQLHGITKKYYEDGPLNGKWRFKNNELIDVKDYYHNGALLRYWDYRQFKSKGIVIIKAYYENGKLLSENIYKNNLLAKAMRYDKYGKVVLNQNYGY